MPGPSSKPHNMKQFVKDLPDPELLAIAGTESSYGQNLEHPEVTAGMHKGMAAGGPFGMMPIVASEVYAKSPELKAKYGWFDDYAKDPQANHSTITDLLNEIPELSYDLARSHFDYLKGRTPSIDKQFYKWTNGQNSEPTKSQLKSSDYVNKTMENLDKSAPRDDHLNRDLLLKLFNKR